MATPFVAGTAALIMSKQPTWTPAQVMNDIEGTAHDVGAPGKDNEWGAGLVDGYAAVAQAAGGSGAAPFPTLHPRITGSLSSSDVFVTTFTLSQADIGTPIAATITTDGTPSCQLDLGPPFGCLL
jgi:serine protease AprX